MEISPFFYAENPSIAVEMAWNAQWQSGLPAGSAFNPALEIEAVGFVLHQGDWLGVAVSPWSCELLLIPGGGSLWGDIPPGQTRYLDLPGGTQAFVAKSDPELGAYQACTLLSSVTALPDQASARRLAQDALCHALGLPLPSPAGAPPESTASSEAAEAVPLSRRGFFRRLAGKR